MLCYVLDADIVSLVLAKDPCTVARLECAFAQNASVLLCPVVFYELTRGLIKKNATRKLQDFEKLASHLLWMDMVRSDWCKASELWAQSDVRGKPNKDADILIASHAITHGAILVTRNSRHFEHLPVQIEDWSDGYAIQ